MFMPCDPERCRYAHRGVGPGDEADQHDQCEVSRGIAAEEVERSHAEERRSQCIEGTTDGLMNGIIGQFRKAVRPAMGMNGFTNTVEDDDRFIHGVTKDRQDRRKEGCIDFQMKNAKTPSTIRISWQIATIADSAIRCSKRIDI